MNLLLINSECCKALRVAMKDVSRCTPCFIPSILALEFITVLSHTCGENHLLLSIPKNHKPKHLAILLCFVVQYFYAERVLRL